VKSPWGKIRRGLLGVPREETGYVRRGFRGATPEMRARLEQVGAAFMTGYNLALERGRAETLAPELNTVGQELCGFAFEGAAMGLALLDCFTPWRPSRLNAFLHGPGQAHTYMVHVGVGWVWARMPLGRNWTNARLDRTIRWLAFDGWGFHEGFFHWPKYICGGEPPKRLKGYERRAFDQGLGRSFWFVNGGNSQLIQKIFADFAPARQGDLWSGLGLAATYAGLADEEVLMAIRRGAGDYWPCLAQGAVFAAKARERAGNLTEYTDLATSVLCGMAAREASRRSDTTLENLPADAAEPAYEIWRQRIQGSFHSGEDREPLAREANPAIRNTNPPIRFTHHASRITP
jgi:hypothetical protein